MKKVLFVFGTRPEAIKMASLFLEFKKSKVFETKLCVTSQHKEMLSQILKFFEIVPDYDLDVMKPNQNLFGLTSEILNKIKSVLDTYDPDLVMVHGDTTSGMTASLASFYNKSKVCHVEAGLRTHNKLSPFPEEINRQITGRVCDIHFAPTEVSKQNLLAENISKKDILILISYSGKTSELKKAVMKTNDGTTMTYHLTKFVSNKDIADSKFVFNKAQYPGFAVIRD